MTTKNFDYAIPLIIPFSGVISEPNEDERFQLFRTLCLKLSEQFLSEASNVDFDFEKIPSHCLGDILSLTFEDENGCKTYDENEDRSILYAMSLYSINSTCVKGKPKRRDLKKIISLVEDGLLKDHLSIYLKIYENQQISSNNPILEDEIDQFFNQLKNFTLYFTLGENGSKREFEISVKLYHSAYEDTLKNIAQQELENMNPLIH